MFLTNFTVLNKQLISQTFLLGLRDQLFNLYIIYKFKIMFLYNEEKPFCTKTELLNLNITPRLTKLDMVSSRLVSNGLITSDDIWVDIQLVNFFTVIYVSELNIGAKTKNFWEASSPVKNLKIYQTKNRILFVIFFGLYLIDQ